MSIIPPGLRADHMRERMEDKATIQHTGGMYVGSTETFEYYDIEGDDPKIAYKTIELYPTDASRNLPLVSNGDGQIPSYQLLTAGGIADGAITRELLGSGTVICGTGSGKKVLSIEEDQNDSNILVIRFSDQQ